MNIHYPPMPNSSYLDRNAEPIVIADSGTYTIASGWPTLSYTVPADRNAILHYMYHYTIITAITPPLTNVIISADYYDGTHWEGFTDQRLISPVVGDVIQFTLPFEILLTAGQAFRMAGNASGNAATLIQSGYIAAVEFDAV